MLEPIFNITDDEWITMVGKYILNMGGVEVATRIIIAQCEGTDRAPAMSADLPARLGYLRRRFPREPKDRHS